MLAKAGIQYAEAAVTIMDSAGSSAFADDDIIGWGDESVISRHVLVEDLHGVVEADRDQL